MSVVTSTNIAKGLKIFFRDSKYDEIIHGMKHRPLLTRCKKTPFVGEDYRVPVYAGHGGGVSPNFADAQNMSTTPTLARFQPGANLVELHKPFQIDSQALARAAGNAAGLMKDVILKSTHIIDHIADELERDLVEDGYAALGTLKSASFATTTMALNTPYSNARWFTPGMRITFTDAKGNALRDSGDYLVVSTAGNPTTGEVELTANMSGISGIATDDVIFIKGMVNAAGVAQGVKGLAAWASTPTASEDFLGQDRSTAAGQLAMLAGTGNDTDMLPGILANDALALEINGGTRNVHLMNPYDFSLLAEQTAGLTQHKPGTKTMAGYSSISVPGVTGQLIENVVSPYLPRLTSYLLNMPSWELVHLRQKPIMMDDLDGSPATKLASASGSEFRGLAMTQFCSCAPGTNVKITWS